MNSWRNYALIIAALMAAAFVVTVVLDYAARQHLKNCTLAPASVDAVAASAAAALAARPDALADALAKHLASVGGAAPGSSPDREAVGNANSAVGTAGAATVAVPSPQPLNHSEIMMRREEIDAIAAQMAHIEYYLEWGSGGSTLNFVPRAQRRAVSVEHDEQWCAHMRGAMASENDTAGVPGARFAHVDYRCVPVPRGYNGWGVGERTLDDGDYPTFSRYVDAVDIAGVAIFDLVLIDGRARVDCAIKTLAYVSDTSVIVLHDSDRVSTIYSDVLKFYASFTSIAGSPGVAFLRRRPQWKFLQGNYSAVQQMIAQKYTHHSSSR